MLNLREPVRYIFIFFILFFSLQLWSQKIQRNVHAFQFAHEAPNLRITTSQMIKIRAGKTKKTRNKSIDTNSCGNIALTPEELIQYEITGEFIVNYNGFSQEAEAAFQHAIDIWSRMITTSVPIEINASFSALGPNVLGAAGPTYILSDIENEPFLDTYYPASLADQLNNMDNIGADIEAIFNSDFNSWYFGLDGCPSFSEYDFVTVVLHEIGHGLGFFSAPELFDFGPLDGELGCYGFDSGRTDPLGFPIFIPIVFDLFVEDGIGRKVSDYDPNFCWGDLLNMFTGNNLFYNSPAMTECNGGPIQLYAPNTFSQGSSYAHFDEQTYGQGNMNALMTPIINNGEAIHDPGCMLAVLNDFGYQANGLQPIIVVANVIPTLNQWGLIILSLLLSICSISYMKRITRLA